MVILLVLIMFGLYGIFHSILASQAMKTAIRERVGDRAYYGFYRAFYNIVALITLIPIFWVLAENPGGTVYTLDDRWAEVILVMEWVGRIGVVVAVLQIDALRFIGLRQIIAYFRGTTLPLPDEDLTTAGLYRVVRHPLYLFSLFIVWSSLSMNAATFALNLGITLYFLVGSIYEERRMVQGYGQSYRDYQAQVPWMIPMLRVGNKN